MPALTITAVQTTANTEFENVNYGATISPGQALYRLADTKHVLADANGSALTKVVRGIAITPGVDNGHGIMATGGNIILVGAGMSPGTTYFAGPTPGQIVPFSDLGGENFVTRIGTAKSATEMVLSIEDTGTQTPA